MCIDSDHDVVCVIYDHMHRVSVFTCEGEFLMSFGEYGREPPGQPSRSRGSSAGQELSGLCQ